MRRRRDRMLRAALLLATTTAIAPNAGRGRLFLDSASVDAWRELLPTGLFYGVTTNPTILRRDGVPCTVPDVAKLARTALGAGCQEVMVQAWGGTVDAYEKCSLDLLDAVGAADHLVIKLPLTRDGVVAAHRLRDEAHLCMTACYGREQALIANALKASYLAPYLGRMGDAGLDGAAECQRIQGCLDGCRSPTRLLVASLRSASTVFDVLSWGSDATFSPDVARELLSSARTDAAAAAFEEDALFEQPLLDDSAG